MLNDKLVTINCVECGHSMSPDQFMVTACPQCGSAWLDAQYNYDAIAPIWAKQFEHRAGSLWRYHELLPLQPNFPDISMGEG